MAQDVTIEKLGELLRDNPNGLLMIWDELSGLLSKLDNDERQSDRAFLLTAFDGDKSFTWDRITRGTVHVEHCIISFVGGIQPSKLGKILSSAINGTGDDGLIQRFQGAVYPDPVSASVWQDVAPNSEAQDNFKKLLSDIHSIQANPEAPRVLRFTADAQLAYATWWEQLQGDIADPELHSVMQSHLGKMPKTIGSLCLLFHLCEGEGDLISKATLDRALLWYPYLKSHATRIYGIVDSQTLASAKRILSKKHILAQTFTVREIRRKGWTGLKNNEEIALAIDILIDHNYLFEHLANDTGAGRPTMKYRWNPKLDKPAEPETADTDKSESDQ